MSFGHYEPGGDDFPGRIAHTVFLLRKYGVSEYLGLSDEFMSKAVDSGIAYLITAQSILVVIALWATIAMAGSEDRPDKTRIIHAVMIYMAFNMIVSFALLTIKTAACCGSVTALSRAEKQLRCWDRRSGASRFGLGRRVGWSLARPRSDSATPQKPDACRPGRHEAPRLIPHCAARPRVTLAEASWSTPYSA